MISALSNSFRTLTLNNASIKSMVVVTQFQIQLRGIHLHQPMLKSIEEKLGLPVKPKKPFTPYFRFLIENRPSLVAQNPNLKPKEITSTLARMYNSLDATKKESLSKAYKNELSNYYSNEYAKYIKTLSEDDKTKIKEMRAKTKKRRVVALKRKKHRELGRPKKVINSFINYMKTQAVRNPNEEYRSFVKRATSSWHELSETEKEKYKPSKEEKLEYEKALLNWEEQMLKLGHDDVVRASSKESTKSSKLKSTTV